MAFSIFAASAAGAAGIFGGPIGWIVFGTGLAVGGVVGAVVKCCIKGRTDGRRFVGLAAPSSVGKWAVATEEGCSNVLIYFFLNEKDAWDAFNSMWVSRIFYNEKGNSL